MSQQTPLLPSGPRQRRLLIRRHSGVTRLTHWLNLFCLSVLLFSGLQIFNAYPRLHWGEAGANPDPAFIEIGSQQNSGEAEGYLKIGDVSLITTGVLGVSELNGTQMRRAFPAWLTLPSYQDLAAGRRWHFFFAWAFVINGLVYLGYSLISGHLRRDLLPNRHQLGLRHLWQEIIDHARLRFPSGDAARRYNALQKLTYIAVIVVLLPVMVLTGLSMSPGMNAAVPELLDLFGGRQSARTLHFITATLLVVFVIVHVAMVILSGPWNNLRSMITGRYAIRLEDPTDE